jgi:hypothetical protein
VHHSFKKLERVLTLVIRRAKGLELMNLFFITHLSISSYKMGAFDLENYGF